MKKAVKSLIIAASVAAIAGIGAVSFAAWTGTSEPVRVAGSAGEVVTRGITLASNTLATDANAVLVPYNQDLNNYPLKGTKTALKVWTITLTPGEGVSTGYTVTVTKGEDNNLTTGKLYVSNANTIDAAKPMTGEGANTGWAEIDTDGASLAPSSSNVIYIVLDTGANGDMNANLQVVVTLDSVSA